MLPAIYLWYRETNPGEIYYTIRFNTNNFNWNLIWIISYLKWPRSSRSPSTRSSSWSSSPTIKWTNTTAWNESSLATNTTACHSLARTRWIDRSANSTTTTTAMVEKKSPTAMATATAPLITHSARPFSTIPRTWPTRMSTTLPWRPLSATRSTSREVTASERAF